MSRTKFKPKSIYRDIVPRPKSSDKLPKLTRRYTSEHGPELMPDEEHSANYLIVRDVARSRADAARLLRMYPDKTLQEIVKLETPKRRFLAPLRRIWQRARRWM